MALADFAGFGIRGYRSFGDPETIAIIGPMSKVHLVVGQNNVGKSNTLHFVADVVASAKRGSLNESELYPGPLDRPEGWPNDVSRVISIGLYRTDTVASILRLDDREIAAFLGASAFTRGFDDVVWFDYEVAPTAKARNTAALAFSQSQVDAAKAEGCAEGNLREVSLRLTSTSGDLAHNVAGLWRIWNPLQFVPEVEWVEAVRQLTAEGQPDLRSGRGIVSRLASLQHPPHLTYGRDAAQFENLQSFVREVLEDDSARIEVPDAKDTILVHGRFGMRPIGNLGTGISELILLAAVATVNSGTLICVEEPELHLHPTMQRKLIAYLSDHTTNHYLMSTHSASLLNASVASVTHLEMPAKISVAQPVMGSSDRARAVSDLGFRASDLVQANFVLWVEGPSDRIYIRKWLQLDDPELLENAHFTIMFYGGALLSHLTVDDAEVDEFVHLLDLNRNLAVVIDSDRTSIDDVLNDTKNRVLAELATLGAVVWVTDDYTIENYLPRGTIEAAIKALYPNRGYKVPASNFKSPLGQSFEGSKSRPSKTTVALHVTVAATSPSDIPPGALSHVREIGAAIREASGLPSLNDRTAPTSVVHEEPR